MIHGLLNGGNININNNSNHSEYLPKAQFVFDYHQYYTLYQTQLTCIALSIATSVIVLLVYGYMLIYHAINAHRVSLHCVILAILVSLVNNCLYLNALHLDVNTDYCHHFLIVDSILTLLTSSLLSVVGIHFFLLFVMDVKWPCRPEYILIPIAIIYSLVGSLYCIFGTDNNTRVIEPLYFEVDNFCWYYSNFVERTYEKKSWEYYYSFLFFITTLAFSLSVIAIWTIYRVKKRSNKQIQVIKKTQTFLDVISSKDDDDDDQEITIDSQHSELQQPHSLSFNSDGSAKVNNNKRKSRTCCITGGKRVSNPIRTSKLQDTSFTKIVLRGLLYPCVPFLMHIWGFILQMQLIDSGYTANFEFCMVGIIISYLEGVFLAFIFFSDPTVYTIPYEIYQKCKKSITLN